MPKSKRLLLTAVATAAVAAAGTWGAVAMAASSPGSTTPKSRTTPKSQTTPSARPAQHHYCPNMGTSSGASSSTMYSPSDV